MDTTVKALQNLYVAKGGELTDTYADIAGGVAVSDYTVIPDMINALAELTTTQAAAAKENEEVVG
jgi:hypothetical protein